MSNERSLFVEKRPEGDYAVRRANSQRASAVLPTQAEAIARAKEIDPSAPTHVERVAPEPLEPLIPPSTNP